MYLKQGPGGVISASFPALWVRIISDIMGAHHGCAPRLGGAPIIKLWVRIISGIMGAHHGCAPRLGGAPTLTIINLFF